MKAVVVALVIAALLLFPAGKAVQGSVHATLPVHVVGSGSPATCTAKAFGDAVALGGDIRFNCGASPFTIIVSSASTILSETVIEGGDKITLSGGNTTRLFLVNTGVSLTLSHLTISNGYIAYDGGAIFNNGSLTVESSVFTHNHTDPDHSGGAIVSYGPLTIKNSRFDQNYGGDGGALFPRFAAALTTITNTTFTNNSTTNTTYGWGGAILVWDGASATITASTFTGNTAIEGGAIFVFPNSTLNLNNSIVSQNKAIAGAATGLGGGLLVDGDATLVGTRIEDNAVTEPGYLINSLEHDGGGVYVGHGGTLRMSGGTLNRNFARRGGGIYTMGFTILGNVTLDGNTAHAGGAIYELYKFSLLNSTLSNNTATRDGMQTTAMPVGSAVDNVAGIMAATNVTISGNDNGLALFTVATTNATLDLYNVTIANNIGWTIGAETTPNTGQLVLINTILENPEFNNCAPVMPASFSSNGSLSNDKSCAWSGSQNQSGVNPQLGRLQNNGGPTQTLLPAPTSLAIDAGVGGASCPDTDQRGIKRPQSAACDVGAVELVIGPWGYRYTTFLPLTKK